MPGGIAEKPGVAQGQIQIREVLSLTLTFDHDVDDGRSRSALRLPLERANRKRAQSF